MSLAPSRSATPPHRRLRAGPELTVLPPLPHPDDAAVRRFEDLVALAAACCEAPLAFFVHAGAVRAGPIAAHGAAPADVPAQPALYLHAAREAELLVVPDTCADARFGDDRLEVAGRPARFQAAAPVRAANGSALGALCVADREPRVLTPSQCGALQRLARQAAAAIELEARVAELEHREAPLLQRAAQQAAAADLGQRALRGLDVYALMEEAAELIAEKLDLTFCQVWELLPAASDSSCESAWDGRPRPSARSSSRSTRPRSPASTS